MLVDFGFTGDAINNNLDLLGIDAAKFDALPTGTTFHEMALQALPRRVLPSSTATQFTFGGEGAGANPCFATRCRAVQLVAKGSTLAADVR